MSLRRKRTTQILNSELEDDPETGIWYPATFTRFLLPKLCTLNGAFK